MSKQIAVVTIGRIGETGRAKYGFDNSEKAYKWMIESGYDMTNDSPYNIAYNKEYNTWARKDNVVLID